MDALRINRKPSPIRLHKLPKNIPRRLINIIPANILWKILFQRYPRKFILKHIRLVQKEYDRSTEEPPRVDDGFEEDEGFLHTVLSLFFEEDLVVFGEGCAEDDGGYGFEAVDPFAPFGALAAYVEHVDSGVEVG